MHISELRPKINKSLKDNQFVEETSDCIVITETNNANKKGTLKNVTIDNSGSVKVWRINLEQKINGLSTNEPTCEVALIIERKKTLLIHLIELKSNQLDFSQITQKIEASINRCYFLLLLNSDNSHSVDYTIKFKGVVFHNPKPIEKNHTTSHGLALHNTFTDSNLPITIPTTLNSHEVVPVKFFD